MSDPNTPLNGGSNPESGYRQETGGYGGGQTSDPYVGQARWQGYSQATGQQQYPGNYQGQQDQAQTQYPGYYPGQYPSYGGYGYGGWNVARRTHGITTAAMVLGILAAAISLLPFVGFLAFILGPLAMLFGIIGIAKRFNRRGFAVTGLVTGAFGVLVSVLYALLLSTMMSYLDTTDTYEFVTRSAGEYHISITTTEPTPEISNNQRGTFSEHHIASNFYGGVVATNVGDNAGSVGCKIFDSDGVLVVEDAAKGIGAQAQCMIGGSWLGTEDEFDVSGILDARTASPVPAG